MVWNLWLLHLSGGGFNAVAGKYLCFVLGKVYFGRKHVKSQL